ncbi:helix-turn-helix transcriptional regulator [Niallia sp. XMNu-256]|uniref:helix-turn-helix domain-containing protein n=1 Tax=Niallia sp. XMNu-256 TaxID=3082444 RepID=UPI0030CBA975
MAFKEKREETVEDTIKAAIADYLQVMEPLPAEEVNSLRSLIFQPGIEKPYALKNRFKEIMKQIGLKAVDLHRDTDISESNLSQILNNKNQNMSLDYFLRIWFALGCPPIGECLYRENI